MSCVRSVSFVKRGLCLSFVAGLFLCTSLTKAEASAQDRINVMFYNVLNLFDNKKDEGKSDWTFLPKGYAGKAEYCQTLSNPFYRRQCLETDWTTDHVKLKVHQMHKAISAFRRDLAPDILGLCEVENHGIVRALAHQMGYDHRAVITTDSPDSRGIDVALIFKPSRKLRYVRHKQYQVPVQGPLTRPTRNLLEVEFLVGKRHHLFVYVNHWPSAAAPGETRAYVARMLRGIIDSKMSRYPKAHFLITGDFNTYPSDRPHPFHDVLLPGKSPSKQLFDVHTTFMNHPKIPGNIKKSLPPGTYFYHSKKIWNLLDRFFVNKNLFDGKGLDFAIESYRIHNPPFLTKPLVDTRYARSRAATRVPFRYDTKTLDPKMAGYSDHFAIKGSLKIH